MSVPIHHMPVRTVLPQTEFRPEAPAARVEEGLNTRPEPHGHAATNVEIAGARILLLGKLPPPYMGPAIATKILLDSKLKERYKLLHVDTNVHESLETLGVWRFDKVWKNLSVYARFVRVVWNEKPDLVLIPISQATLGFLKDSPFILLSKLLRRKVLIQLRGSNIQNWLAGVPALLRAYVETLLRMAEGVVVLGDNLRHLFTGYFPENRIFVVPNGANYHIPAREARTSQVNVLYLANLQPAKGIEDVIRAVQLLKERGINGFNLNVVGEWRDAETRETCLRLVEEYALPVIFHGPAYDTNKFRFMAQADVFVFTPREPEGHPWVIVEALASGLPIIATDQGAITESVLDGINGFIVDSRSPWQIADRIQQLIERPDLRRKQSAASRKHYEDNFTEEKMVERLSAAFDQVLQHAPR